MANKHKNTVKFSNENGDSIIAMRMKVEGGGWKILDGSRKIFPNLNELEKYLQTKNYLLEAKKWQEHLN